MKVICIDQPKPIPGHEDVPNVIEGNIYTVRDEGHNEDLGQYYTFYELPWHCAYSKIHFVPLSEINEMELERNYNKELV